MIVFIKVTMSFFSLNWLITLGCLCPDYLLTIQSEWTHRKVSFTEQKGRLNIISYDFYELFQCSDSESVLFWTEQTNQTIIEPFLRKRVIQTNYRR